MRVGRTRTSRRRPHKRHVRLRNPRKTQEPRDGKRRRRTTGHTPPIVGRRKRPDRPSHTTECAPGQAFENRQPWESPPQRHPTSNAEMIVPLPPPNPLPTLPRWHIGIAAGSSRRLFIHPVSCRVPGGGLVEHRTYLSPLEARWGLVRRSPAAYALTPRKISPPPCYILIVYTKMRL